MDIKSFIKDRAEKEKKNHRILNIMAISVLTITIILVFCFGVKVNVGVAVLDSGENITVKQSIFQVAGVVTSSNMTKDEAVNYVNEVNKTLKNEYGINGLNPDTGAFHNLSEQFNALVKQLGKDASKINILKYKFALAVAVGDPNDFEQNKSLDGSRIFATAGQLILVSVVQLALFVIALIMLVFAVIAMVKKRKFTKVKFMFILLLIGAFANIVLFSSMSFVSINWAGILSIIITFLGMIFYCLLQYALMDKKDFSFTMLIHNLVLLGGSLLSLIFFLSPMFKLTAVSGASQSLGWAYLMDYMLAEMSYMSAVMAYTLTEILMLITVMLPAILLIILAIRQLARFMSTDYQHNERKVYISIMLAVNFLIFLLFAAQSGGGLSITSQDIKVSMNIALALIQLLTVGGMLAFELLYKVKPVKKELVVR